MFREMIRKHQQIPQEECVEVLKTQPRGVLSVLGDEGYPYGTPINHWYSEKDGRLYFHSSMKGHRVDAMETCDKASFCVYDGGYRNEGEWALNIKSVIVFGRIQIVEDFDEAMDICRKLCYKFTTDSDYIEKEIRVSGKNTLCFKLIPEHITGKKVNES